jgi:hypothetical protein
MEQQIVMLCLDCEYAAFAAAPLISPPGGEYTQSMSLHVLMILIAIPALL